MESKVRIVVGLLVLCASTQLHGSSLPHFRPRRNASLAAVPTDLKRPKESSLDVINDTANVKGSKDVALEESAVESKLSKITSEKTRYDWSKKEAQDAAIVSNKQKAQGDNYGNDKIILAPEVRENTDNATVPNKETARSLNIDIDKYTSPEFQNKNNVYVLPTSSDIEKFLDPEANNFKAYDVSKELAFTPHDFRSILTTPQTNIFDDRHRDVADGIKQNLEELDSDKDKYEVLKLSEVPEKNVSVHFVEYKSIDKNSNEKQGKVQSDTDIEAAKHLDYNASFVKTSVIAEKNSSTSSPNKITDTKQKTDPEPESSSVSPESSPVTISTVRSVTKNKLSSTEKSRISSTRSIPVTNRAPHNQTATGNTINIFKRGSTKYTDTISSSTPSFNKDLVYDNKNFSLPPSATAWTLVGMRQTPVTIRDVNNSTKDEKEQDVQENQLFKTTISSSTKRYEGITNKSYLDSETGETTIFLSTTDLATTNSVEHSSQKTYTSDTTKTEPETTHMVFTTNKIEPETTYSSQGTTTDSLLTTKHNITASSTQKVESTTKQAESIPDAITSTSSESIETTEPAKLKTTITVPTNVTSQLNTSDGTTDALNSVTLSTLSEPTTIQEVSSSASVSSTKIPTNSSTSSSDTSSMSTQSSTSVDSVSETPSSPCTHCLSSTSSSSSAPISSETPGTPITSVTPSPSTTQTSFESTSSINTTLNTTASSFENTPVTLSSSSSTQSSSSNELSSYSTTLTPSTVSYSNDSTAPASSLSVLSSSITPTNHSITPSSTSITPSSSSTLSTASDIPSNYSTSPFSSSTPLSSSTVPFSSSASTISAIVPSNSSNTSLLDTPSTTIHSSTVMLSTSSETPSVTSNTSSISLNISTSTDTSSTIPYSSNTPSTISANTPYISTNTPSSSSNYSDALQNSSSAPLTTSNILSSPKAESSSNTVTPTSEIEVESTPSVVQFTTTQELETSPTSTDEHSTVSHTERSSVETSITEQFTTPLTTHTTKLYDTIDEFEGNDEHDYDNPPIHKDEKIGHGAKEPEDVQLETHVSEKPTKTTVKIPIVIDRNVATSADNATAEPTSSTESLSHDGKDDDGGNPGIVAAIAISGVAGICLVVVAGLLLVMRKRQKKMTYGQRCRPVSLDAYSLDNVSVYNSVRRKGASRASKRSYGNPAFEDPVSVSHQMNFQVLSKFSENTDGINAEFDEIPTVSARASEVPAGCETKNRYANVIPLPETRVFLKPSDNDPNSDYINANYVTGPKNTRGYYIACQGPLQSTVDDFWRMIWEQQSRVILMLTNLYENGIEKCADYLPPSEVLDCHRLFGDYQITLKKREVKEKYVISSLQLKNMVSNSWREVTHLWYLGWPERGVPAEANSLIAFLIEARSHLKAASNNNNDKMQETSNVHISNSGLEGGPVVVHCSPGTGRTGTVIACDIAIRDFELTRSVDIPKIVCRVRRDRASAVQTKEQYYFIYKVISLYATKLTGGALDSI